MLSQWIYVQGEDYQVFCDTRAIQFLAKNCVWHTVLSKKLVMNEGVEFVNAGSLNFSGVGGSEVSEVPTRFHWAPPVTENFMMSLAQQRTLLWWIFLNFLYLIGKRKPCPSARI